MDKVENGKITDKEYVKKESKFAYLSVILIFILGVVILSTVIYGFINNRTDVFDVIIGVVGVFVIGLAGWLLAVLVKTNKAFKNLKTRKEK